MMNKMWIKRSNNMMIYFNGLSVSIRGYLLGMRFSAISASIFGKHRRHLLACENRLNCWGAFV